MLKCLNLISFFNLGYDNIFFHPVIGFFFFSLSRSEMFLFKSLYCSFDTHPYEMQCGCTLFFFMFVYSIPCCSFSHTCIRLLFYLFFFFLFLSKLKENCFALGESFSEPRFAWFLIHVLRKFETYVTMTPVMNMFFCLFFFSCADIKIIFSTNWYVQTFFSFMVLRCTLVV